MVSAARRKAGSLVESYCVQLGAMAERRYTEIALVRAKQQAETAALLAHDAMLQAQAADRAKTNFLANVTHELRTPLNAIIGFADIIATAPQPSAGAPPGTSSEYARYIRDAGAHLLLIVNGVLDLARIEAGKLALEEESVPLDELVGAALNGVRGAAEKKTLDLSLSAGTGAVLSLDAAKISRALVNILSNAVKFSEPGGCVTVSTEIRSSGDAVITVTDTGQGIPHESLDSVLEPFGQVEDHLTRRSEGVGLGLPIARALTELHGGRLVLASEPGAGTSVEIHLPGTRRQPATDPAFNSEAA